MVVWDYLVGNFLLSFYFVEDISLGFVGDVECVSFCKVIIVLRKIRYKLLKVGKIFVYCKS